MKCYFTGSIVGKRQYLDRYQKIITHLKKRGYDVQAEHILDADESKISLETREERLSFHKQLEDWIAEAEFMVAETSFPSISVGYEISLALTHRKPVLILYTEGDPPSLMRHHMDEKIVCEKYSLTTVEAIIDDFINFAQGTIDTRFTFFITPKIAAYLERVAKQKKVPKSVYLRRLIEEDMANNK